jgi:hypothetical protein
VLAVRWVDLDLALPRPTLTFSGTLVQVKGRGLFRQPWTKSDAGYPRWVRGPAASRHPAGPACRSAARPTPTTWRESTGGHLPYIRLSLPTVRLGDCGTPKKRRLMTAPAHPLPDQGGSMKFVQIIEFEATDEQLAQGDALVEDYMKQTEGRRMAGRSILLRDRANPSKYYNVVEFESYEDAMRNNELPETQALSQSMMSITSGAPRFIDCDVVRESS